MHYSRIKFDLILFKAVIRSYFDKYVQRFLLNLTSLVASQLQGSDKNTLNATRLPSGYFCYESRMFLFTFDIVLTFWFQSRS